MTYSLTWLADCLLAAGLKVAETDGWRERGHGDVGPIKGVICHHTAGSAHGNMPTLGMVIDGRPAAPGVSALAGPLAQLALGRDGTFYVVAAGKAWHAGAGVWNGVATGNTNFIGIEAENVGTEADPWPPVQIDAYKRGVAAILKQINAPNESWCCGHKEFAPKRKIDPSFDMDAFRLGVKAISIGNAPAPAPIPHTDEQNRPTLRRGSTGEAVKTVQTKVGATASGVFDGDTEAKVRILQRQNNLVPDGIVGPKTWAAITL